MQSSNTLKECCMNLYKCCLGTPSQGYKCDYVGFGRVLTLSPFDIFNLSSLSAKKSTSTVVKFNEKHG